MTTYSRTTFKKRELYTWPVLDKNDGYVSVATVAGDNVFVAQGDKVNVFSKSSGAGKVLVPDLQENFVAKALVADDKNLFVRTGDLELYDASTGAYVKTLLFSPPSTKYGTSAIASDATFFYAFNQDALVKARKDTSLNFLNPEPFGTPSAGVPTSLLLSDDRLWMVNDKRKLFNMPVASGATTQVLDGATVGFAAGGHQYLLAVDDDKIVISLNDSRSRVMITDIASGATYYLP